MEHDVAKLRALFDEVIQTPQERRDELLERRCGSDAELRRRIEAMIATAEGDSPFLADPTAGPTAVDLDPETKLAVPLGEGPGTRIGPYKLLQLIGEGGFGSVFMAEQETPVRRRVALKIIKLGMDTKQVIARFEAERQALAMMDHPNIARVFDAGATETGRPYFVMELVRGSPITEYCDTDNLSIPQRLALFIQICHAVQHAHHKGVIHRDIKPSNILVGTLDGELAGFAKVIDFGIARATDHRLTEKTLFTEHKALIGTPEYMSPEQAEGSLDIDTRTDVYSLGVLLYELLTGLLPFDPKTLRNAAYAEIQRIIREVEPPKPSTRLSSLRQSEVKRPERRPSGSSAAGADGGQPLPDDRRPDTAAIAHHRGIQIEELTRQLRRELEWIPLKAMRKERSQRYRTPIDLADDITNYLAGIPLEAGPEAASYRLRKFVRRNKGPVAAAAVIALTLLAGTTGTMLFAVKANRNAIRADEEAALARAAEQRAVVEADTARTAERIADARAKEARWQSYLTNIAAADAALRVNEIATVRARLAACPEPLRNWEWRYLESACDSSLLSLGGQEHPVAAATFSPDGTRILTASDDGTARVWDSASGKEIATLRGHEGGVGAAAFSPDGTRIVTASHDHTARLWDSDTGSEIAVLRGHESALVGAAFSPDGTRIVTASFDETARVWDSLTGSEIAVLRGHEGWVRARFSPDGTRIVTVSDEKTARVWDSSSGRLIALLRGHEREVRTAAFSPDGTRIVTTASWDATARVWDSTTGSEILVLLDGILSSATFSPDGTHMVTASWDATARVWDSASGSEIAVLRGHEGILHSATFSPDGTRIVTASPDKTARVWNSATGNQIAVLRGHEKAVSSAAFSPDGARLLTTSEDKTARVWNVPAEVDYHPGEIPPIGEMVFLHGHEWDVTSVAFSPDGTRILTASDDKTARVWDSVTGAQLAVLRGHQRPVASAAFSRAGTRIVTTSDDKTARVWDSATGNPIAVLRGPQTGVAALRFSPDGASYTTMSDDNIVRLWDSGTGREIAVLHSEGDHVTSGAFSRDGTRLVTVSDEGTAWIWNSATGSKIAVVRGVGDVTCAAVSPDGTRIVVGSDDNTARVWDSTTGSEIAALRGHEGQVNSVAFSPDGTRIVTASEDHTARLWDSATGSEILVLRSQHGSNNSAAFSPDGTQIVDSSGPVWDSVPYRARHAQRQELLRAAPAAEALVDRTSGAGLSFEQMAAEVRRNTSIDDATRRVALDLILIRSVAKRESVRQEVERLNREAWLVVRDAGGDAAMYAAALKMAEAALAGAPKNASITNTLGVAQYRNGWYEQALETLGTSDAVHSGQDAPVPADVAFIAMAQFRLGQVEQARESLQRLRTLMQKENWANNDEARAFAAEAQALIEPRER